MPSELDQMMEEIEKASISTSQGSYVRVEDVSRLLRARQETEEKPKPQPKTMAQAKEMARKDETLFPPSKPHEPGKSVSAGPQPPSRA